MTQGAITARPCIIPSCPRPVAIAGLCELHYEIRQANRRASDTQIDVRRVAWFFWTWRFRIGHDVEIGAGRRRHAAVALDRFLAKHGATEVDR